MEEGKRHEGINATDSVVNRQLAAECVNFYLRLSPLLLFMSLNHDMSYLRVTKTCFK